MCAGMVVRWTVVGGRLWPFGGQTINQISINQYPGSVLNIIVLVLQLFVPASAAVILVVVYLSVCLRAFDGLLLVPTSNFSLHQSAIHEFLLDPRSRDFLITITLLWYGKVTRI